MSLDPKTPCKLCALEIGPNPHVVHTREENLVFCCDGCVGIYKMINDVEEVEKSDQNISPSSDMRNA